MSEVEYSILIVEDDQNYVDTLRRILRPPPRDWEEHVFDLICVDRVSRALEQIRTGPDIDGILLDLGLPDSQGIDSLRPILLAAPEIPVVVVTGTQDRALALTALREGAQDYIVKGDVHGKMLARVLRYAIERKRAAVAFRESEERFRQLAENIHQAFWLLDRNRGQVLYASPAYASVFQRPLETVYKEPFDWLTDVLPEDRPRVEAAFQNATERLFDEEFRIQSPNGDIKWIHSRAYPIRDGARGICRVAGIAEDITERKALANQLAQSQKLESLGQLAAGIAHEINTPLQFVGDNMRFLQDSLSGLLKPLAQIHNCRKAADQEASPLELPREFLDELDAADLDFLLEEIPTAFEQSLDGLERLTKIVRAMKEFSHPGVHEKIPTDINKAIETTTIVARNEWKYVADLETDLDDSLPLVPVLPSELNQVILALTVNAAHAIEDALGGESSRKGRIGIATCVEGDEVLIRIADSGTGIPEAARARVFEPFFTTKALGKGTGQGLAIARSIIVEDHGGTLTLETEIGTGTTFTIRLPLVDSTATGKEHGQIEHSLCR